MQERSVAEGRSELILYCLTRDPALAAAIEARLLGAITMFYNDSARLHQAIGLRRPDTVVIDAAAVRPEYGDEGLGPEVAIIRGRAPEVGIGVRPTPGAEVLIAAEAGPEVTMLPAELVGCVEAIARLCGCA